MAEFPSEVRTDIAELCVDVRGELAEFPSEMRTDIAELCVDVGGELANEVNWPCSEATCTPAWRR
jgi:hypothetical protein